MRDPLWYKDAIIYQLHVEAFLDRRPALIARRAGISDVLTAVCY
jgi:hypothetical protein